MRAGKLRHKVKIQEQVETANAYGELEISWSDLYKNVWAEIRPIRGTEFFASKQWNAEITTRIYMRYRPGITAKMRVLYGTDEYYIDTPLNIGERNRELHLMCTRAIE